MKMWRVEILLTISAESREQAMEEANSIMHAANNLLIDDDLDYEIVTADENLEQNREPPF